MLGRHREPARAVVIARQERKRSILSQEGVIKYDYVVDVTPENGNAPFRATLKAVFFTDTFMLAPAVGDEVPVTLRGEDVELDVDELKRRDDEAKQGARDEFAQVAAALPGTPPPATATGADFASDAADFRRQAGAFPERTTGTTDLLAELLKAKQAGDAAEVERIKAQIAAQQGG